MGEITADKNLVACCGLFCGACGSYLKGKCPGCRENKKAGWCKVRACCLEGGIQSCADCTKFPDALGCKKFNNPVAKLFALFFKSDRPACIRAIKADGYEVYAREMAAKKKMTIQR